jgi:hypothetical protein
LNSFNDSFAGEKPPWAKLIAGIVSKAEKKRKKRILTKGKTWI